MVVKTRDGRNSYAWHGIAGMVIYTFAIVSVITGFNCLLPNHHVWRGVVTVRSRARCVCIRA
jgi:hypothetical protein